jgi:hypothetical protein
MAIACPDWQQDGVARLRLAAMAANVRCGVWVTRVEELDDDDLVGDALSLRTR